MAAIGSDADKPAAVTPAASTRKRRGDVTAGPDVFVRDISHYATGGEEAGQ